MYCWCFVPWFLCSRKIIPFPAGSSQGWSDGSKPCSFSEDQRGGSYTWIPKIIVFCVLKHSHITLSEYRVPCPIRMNYQLSHFFYTLAIFGVCPTFRHILAGFSQTPSDSWMMALQVKNARSLQYLRRRGGSGAQAISKGPADRSMKHGFAKPGFRPVWNCPDDGVWFMHSLVRNFSRGMLLKQNKGRDFLVRMLRSISPKGFDCDVCLRTIIL